MFIENNLVFFPIDFPFYPLYNKTIVILKKDKEGRS